MTNKELVLKAMTELFVNRNLDAIELYWGAQYLQHNPHISDGHGVLKEVVANLGQNFSYTPGYIVADDDLVMIHGRYVGWSQNPMLAVDIFRVKDSKLVEHWDVMQEEISADKTKSGRTMFTNEADFMVLPQYRAVDHSNLSYNSFDE